MEDIKLSIIIPCYNVEKYISDGLNSIFCINDINFEVICVNDGSKDSTLEILNKYAKKEKRLKVIDQVNKGASIARRAGFIEAKGEYVLFHDGDNGFNKDVKFGSFLKGDDIYALNSSGIEKVNIPTSLNDLYDQPAGVWTRVFKKDVIDHMDFKNYKMANDLPITFSAYSRAKKIISVNQYFEITINNKDGITNNINIEKVKDTYKSIISSGLEGKFLDYRINYQLAGVVHMMRSANKIYDKREILKFLSSKLKKHKIRIKGNHYIKLKLLRFKIVRIILLWKK